MNRLFVSVLLLIAALFPPTVAAQSTLIGADVNGDSLLRHIKVLASDAFEGRATGSSGNNLAAQYLSDQFRSLGLSPLSPLAENTYYQPFTVTAGATLRANNSLAVKNKAYKAGQDFLPLGLSTAARINATEFVFVGYGIETADSSGKKYSDYDGVEVKGKIAVMMRFSPDGNNPHSDFYDHSILRTKLALARDKGASAVLIFTGAEDDEDDKLLKFGDNSKSDAGIAAMNVSRLVISRLMKKSEKDLQRLQRRINTGKKAESFTFTSNLALQTDVGRVQLATQNVIGYLKGNDEKLRDEFIIIGGHFDHLGYGGDGSGSLFTGERKIHTGADDNASGTAGVLEAARVFAARRTELKRSVIFACFSGEEMGLLGSAYYTSHPLVPLEKTGAMLNMDMVGRLKDSALAVGGIGTAKEWREICTELNAGEFRVKFSEDGFGPSDHASFYAKNIPVLFFFTGNHANYHKPTDTWDKINSTGHAQVVRYVCRIASRLNAMPDRLTFSKAKSDNTMSSSSSGGFRVSFGTIPNYAAEVEGVMLDGVREGSVAEKAGVKAGDIIVRFAGKSVRSIYDYTDALRGCKPGDRIALTVKRGTGSVELQAAFPEKDDTKSGGSKRL